MKREWWNIPKAERLNTWDKPPMKKPARDGMVWLCLQCGKHRKDMYSREGSWDEACIMNCVEADEKTLVPDPVQVEELMKQRDRILNKPLSETIEEIYNSEPDPELLALAQKAIEAQDARKASDERTRRDRSLSATRTTTG